MAGDGFIGHGTHSTPPLHYTQCGDETEGPFPLPLTSPLTDLPYLI